MSDPASSFDSDAFREGEKVRRAVLGNEYVDKALAKGQSEYTRPLQQFITEYAWGTVWTRPELERKQRSLISMSLFQTNKFVLSLRPFINSVQDLAFLIALKSWPELRLHTKGSIRNGLSIIEIREVVLQSMIYVGVPAGVEAMKQTETAINEMVEAGECEALKPNKSL